MNLQKLIDVLREKLRAIRKFFAPGADDGVPARSDSDRSDPGEQPEISLPEETNGVSDGKSSEADDAGTAEMATMDESSKNKESEKQPWNRPGQRKGDERRQHTHAKLPDGQILPPETKPELICRETRAPQRWQIFLVLPAVHNAVVFQGEKKLTSNADGEYPLSDFTTPVKVTAAESGQVETIELFDGAHSLIFKLRKDWKGDGRRSKMFPIGCYMAFAPRDWRRDGHVPVAPSECTDNNFSAHYVFADGEEDAGGFNGHPFVYAHFSLDGTVVVDDADNSDYGNLFVGKHLELAGIDDDQWQGVSWVRVGEEGGGRWGENFKPTKNCLSKVLNGREGWFYLRVYDDAVDLLDSFAFRRLAGLEKISVDGDAYSPENIIAPTDNGHAETAIQFVGVRAESASSHITMAHGTARIAAHPNADDTQWKLIGRNGQAPARICLPRIWWCLCNNGEMGEWCATALQMTRDEFRKERGSTMLVRLPATAGKIYAGFSRYDGARSYSAENNDGAKQAKFQLRNFCNHREIAEKSVTESALRIWCGDATCDLIQIRADALATKPVKVPKPGPKPLRMGVFRPAAKNKRFSRLEIKEAGVSPDAEKNLRIAIDTRRKTMHNEHMAALQKHFGGNHAD
ncbi:MAG: hypothetical protein OD918_07180 [Gammaproteobacteria bacterium]